MLAFNWHLLGSSILLGWGAAVPIGPINLEMMRRNLTYGARFGVGIGLGACSADLTYVILLCLGALALLNHALVLQIIGAVGSCILAWFGWGALRAKALVIGDTGKKPASMAKSWLEGYVLTLINPFTILFWASVSAQLLTLTAAHSNAIIIAATGVMMGTFSWVCIYNGVLHLTRHKLTPHAIRGLNIAGGLILLGFSAYGLFKAFSNM